jgi:hypothetical protein
VIVAAAWIDGIWIYSHLEEQSARFWIHRNWIWGPDRADTGHWIQNGWIYGPRGNSVARTAFYVDEGWIYGPHMKLPFA